MPDDMTFDSEHATDSPDVSLKSFDKDAAANPSSMPWMTGHGSRVLYHAPP